MKTLAAMALSAVSLLAASGAQATLFTRLNGQAVYDDQADLTWLRDANYAKTSGYDGDGDGLMTWYEAMDWAAGLSIGGVTGWRLPGGTMGNGGYNKTASERGNMFYNVLDGVAQSGISAPYNADYDLFQNIQSDYYWSGVAAGSGTAWYFVFGDGYLDFYFKDYDLFAWAVHDGDVPAPGTLALLGAGLLGWAGVKRSRHRVGAVIG